MHPSSHNDPPSATAHNSRFRDHTLAKPIHLRLSTCGSLPTNQIVSGVAAIQADLIWNPAAISSQHCDVTGADNGPSTVAADAAGVSGRTGFSRDVPADDSLGLGERAHPGAGRCTDVREQRAADPDASRTPLTPSSPPPALTPREAGGVV